MQESVKKQWDCKMTPQIKGTWMVKLFLKVISKLDKEEEFLFDNIYKIDNKDFSDGDMSENFAYTLDCDYLGHLLVFNVSKMKILTAKAAIGTIVHELAHIKDNKTSFKLYRKALKKFNKKLHTYLCERKADKIASSWGFKEEIKIMRKEAGYLF